MPASRSPTSRGIRRRRWGAVLAGAGLAAACLTATTVARADPAPWLDPAWTARRVVDAIVQPTGRPGAEVAVHSFYSGGLVRKDGADIRVATDGRKPVPTCVLQVGPGDLVRVAWAADPAKTRYYIYYGNPDARPPESWRPRRGLLLEVRRWPGGDLRKLPTVERIWDGARPMGADFVETTSFGHNPFADASEAAIFRFTGYLAPPEAGAYQMATSSSGPSWLLIDDQPVVEWAGHHGAVPDARHARSVTLTGGVHKLTYWYVTPGGTVTAVAAARPPKANRFAPLPPKAFLPVRRAKHVELDLKGEQVVADFDVEHAGEAWWPDHYAVRLRFTNQTRGASGRGGAQYAWDFGDGQTSTDASPVHLYLAHGPRDVSLTVRRGRLENTFRTTVWVERDWRAQTEKDIQSARRYAEQVAQYDFETLDLESLERAVGLFEEVGRTAALVRAASALLFKREGVEVTTMRRVARLLAEALREERKAEEAARVLREVERRTTRGKARSPLVLDLAEVLLDDLHRLDEAEVEYRAALAAFPKEDLNRRRALVGLGDIRRHQGKADEARKLFDQAEAITVEARSPQKQAVRIGTLARYVEEYTRNRDWHWAFHFLRQWAWEFPHEMLGGHWSLLRARALRGKGNWEGAIREAEALLASNPASAYAVRLLILAADGHAAMGREPKARLLLETAVEDYPEDPHVGEAASKLRNLDVGLVPPPPPAD